MKVLSILSCVVFVISILIIGCGEERNIPTAEDQQALMAPKNPKAGNAYGQNKIWAINTASGEIVCVPEIAVEKSPVLIKLPEPQNNKDFSDFDVIIIVKGTAGKIDKKDTLFLFYGQLYSGDTYESFYNSFIDQVSTEYEILSRRLEHDHIGNCSFGVIKIIIKDVPLNNALFEYMNTTLLGMMTDVDAYSNS